jgi:hypothetical protein
MISEIGKIIENFDFIGKRIDFRIQNSTKVRTSCGGISSMLILFFLFWIFYLFFLPLIKREEPDITYLHLKNMKTEFLNNQNFFLGYSILNSEDKPIDDNLFKYIKVNLTNIRSDSIQSKGVKLYKFLINI